MNFKMTIMPAIERGPQHEIEFKFETFSQMVITKQCCADLMLFLQDGIRVMKDYSNAFILEELVDGDWQECDEDHEDVTHAHKH